MGWILGLAFYFIIWWTLLFAILPFGVRSQQEMNNVVPGSEPGAPASPQLGRKILVNTVISALLWVIADFFYIRYFLQ